MCSVLSPRNMCILPHGCCPPVFHNVGSKQCPPLIPTCSVIPQSCSYATNSSLSFASHILCILKPKPFHARPAMFTRNACKHLQSSMMQHSKGTYVSQVHFSVSGVAVAPSVQLSTSCLSFGSLQAHGILAKAVYIHNKAELPIYFEFVTDPRGVFAFDRVRGSVAGMSSVHVTVTFQPKEASNFWRRITCLVRVSCPADMHHNSQMHIALYCLHGMDNSTS